MLTFNQFLTESIDSTKLTHIEHLEDHPINDGEYGANHALQVLDKTHAHIKAGKNDSNLSMKYDGSPSIVYGHHPQTGKFFVASKSAFNKNPKLNYTSQDIQANHGHAPGLVNKLTAALHHLPKIAPKKGVYQGDLMFTHDDVHHHEGTGSASFTPNTITYTSHGEQAKAVKKAKVGLVTHTQYHGSTIEDLKSDPHPNMSAFKHHEDVFHQTVHHDTAKTKIGLKHERAFRSNKKAAEEFLSKPESSETFAATSGHRDHLKTYINSTVRTGEEPTAEGFKQHVIGKIQKEASKLKTDHARGKRMSEISDITHHVDSTAEHYNKLFKFHGHLQKAKNALVDVLNQHEGGFDHHISGVRSKPEGFVVHHNGQPTKLVDRAQFSRANLLKHKQ